MNIYIYIDMYDRLRDNSDGRYSADLADIKADQEGTYEANEAESEERAYDESVAVSEEKTDDESVVS